MFRQAGAEYFNPDEAARLIQSANPGTSQEDANAAAWQQGKRLLERAIAERCDFAFETTLGGRTITGLLERALSSGIEVRVWYVGLDTPELHVARVRARVARGGHDIPEARVRDRFDTSRLNLIRLLPRLTELVVYDNSAEADPRDRRRAGATARPALGARQDHRVVRAAPHAGLGQADPGGSHGRSGSIWPWHWGKLRARRGASALAARGVRGWASAAEARRADMDTRASVSEPR